MLKRHYGLVTLTLYSLLTLILTYPVIFHLTDAIAGFKGEDNLQWRWFLWWFKYALLNLHTSVTDLSLLYAPTGGQQPLYAITVFIPALALPLTLLAGPTISYNLSFLLSFALSAYTMYLLAYYLTRQRLAAFVAGLIFGFYPARFGYATGTFLGQLTTYFLPLYVLALLLLAQRPTWRRVVWLAVILAGLCLTWPLHVMYGVVVFTLPFLAWQGWRWWRCPAAGAHIKYFAIAFGLALVFIIGLYWPLLISTLRGSTHHFSGGNSTYFSLDVLAFVSPSNYHPVLQPLGWLPGYVGRVLADRDDIQERLAYLGVTPMLLALVGLFKFRRRLWFWLVIALAAMTLSLGPLLKFNGRLAQFNIDGYVGYIVLPYALLGWLPVLEWSGVLGRLNVATMLCLAVLAAYGLTYLLSKVKRGWAVGLVSILTAFILFEFLTIFPFPTQPDEVPAFYGRLRSEAQTRPQVIIDLPLKGDPSYNNYSMHYQTVHTQPIAGGHFMRQPAGAREMIAFINRLLLSPPVNLPALPQPDTAARLGLLNKFGFTKIVAREQFMADPAGQAQVAYLSSWLGQPRAEGEVSVFEIPPGGTPPVLTALLDGDGWQASESPGQLQLRAPADVLLYSEAEQDVIMVHLSLSAPTPDRYFALDLDGQPAARLYLSRETLRYNVPLSVRPGAHQLTFRPKESCQHDCAPVNFDQIAFEFGQSHPAPVNFDNRFNLVNYEVSGAAAKPGQPVLLYLYWRGETRVDADYSVFVHLISPAGKIISQADYLLGSSLYPTSMWPAGYLTAMPTLFFIPPDAAPGEYRLQAGLYRLDTGERVPVSVAAGAQDSVLLSRIMVKP